MTRLSGHNTLEFNHATLCAILTEWLAKKFPDSKVTALRQGDKLTHTFVLTVEENKEGDLS